MKVKNLCAFVLTVVLSIGVLSACGNSYEPSIIPATSDVTGDQITATDEKTEPATTVPPTTAAPTLSEECDKVMASGYDGEGNFYELVANETEDYTGTTIEMGVIKNNEWIIPLTADNPFVNKSGLLLRSSSNSYEGSIYEKVYNSDSYENDIHYVGNGCFYHRRTIWNSNNGNVGKANLGGKSGSILPTLNKVDIINKEKKTLILDLTSYYLLDLDTMEKKPIDVEYNYPYYVCNFSEGVFAFVNFNQGTSKNNGFYDENGNLVIDLSGYNLKNADSRDLIFNNGTCTFTHTNDQGTEYKLTIDKRGNVLSSEEAN